MNSKKRSFSEIQKKKERRVYTDEFKKDAIRRIEHGAKITHLAKELRLSVVSLHSWRKEFGAGKGIIETLKKELAIARLEIEYLRKNGHKADIKSENEFLKKKLELLDE